MSVPYIPQATSKRFRVPRTLAADFDAFLDRDIPNTNMDFEILKNWYAREEDGYKPTYVRGEIYPDSTKSRYENTDNNLNIRCSVSSGIQKGDMLIQPDGQVFVLDWAVALQSNNAPSRALRCNLILKIEERIEEDIDDEGYVRHNGNPTIKTIVPEIPCNAYRYDGRPEYVAVSGTPGTMAGVLSLLTVQYNEKTKRIKIGHTFEWGEETYEIVDVSRVGLNLLEENGTLKLQAKRAAGGLHGY